MQKTTYGLSLESGPILDRVITAYGFTSKMMLVEHLGTAASSLSGRYKRGGFPADRVVRCMAETGASLEWRVTGKGEKLDQTESNLLEIPRQKIVDGQLYEAGVYMFDKASFLRGNLLPTKPACVIEGDSQYIIEQHFPEIYDDTWLVKIEGKASIRILTRIPVKKVRVSGVGVSFNCLIEDINILGRVALTIK
ncbi:phage repressor protein CI [Lonsdalea quercina]|uniref:phage repressor protein CI n=1 Tax=Lonsdalea quercina TaxID=71657 RepID=UPI00397691D2